MTITTPVSPQRPVPEPPKTGPNLIRIIMIASGVLIGALVLIFIIALLVGGGDVQQIGTAIEVARDLVIIFLALEGILIVLALAVLIVQVARLINLLQTEVKPVLKNTQDTMQSAKGTVDFVGETVAGPVIRASAFMSGVGVFVSNVGGIRRALKKQQEKLT